MNIFYAQTVGWVPKPEGGWVAHQVNIKVYGGDVWEAIRNSEYAVRVRFPGIRLLGDDPDRGIFTSPAVYFTPPPLIPMPLPDDPPKRPAA